MGWTAAYSDMSDDSALSSFCLHVGLSVVLYHTLGLFTLQSQEKYLRLYA